MESSLHITEVFFSDAAWYYVNFNPRTYKFIPPPWWGGGEGGGWMEPLPGIFDILQYFGAILPLVESRWSSAQDEVYFMGGGAVGSCDVTNNGRHLGRHLGFYRELEIKLKPREMVIFCALYEK